MKLLPVFVVGCLVLAGCHRAPSGAWNKTEAMIPMRDGVKLHTLIFAPERTAAKLPFLIERSPYGFDNGRADVRWPRATRSWPMKASFSSCRTFAAGTVPKASS